IPGGDINPVSDRQNPRIASRRWSNLQTVKLAEHITRISEADGITPRLEAARQPRIQLTCAGGTDGRNVTTGPGDAPEGHLQIAQMAAGREAIDPQANCGIRASRRYLRLPARCGSNSFQTKSGEVAGGIPLGLDPGGPQVLRFDPLQCHQMEIVITGK